MGNSDALERSKLSLYARDVGLDVAAFDKCVDSGRYASEIKESMETGTRLGVEGTPTFFLGFADANGSKVESVQRLEGAIPYSQLKDDIDHILIQANRRRLPRLHAEFSNDCYIVRGCSQRYIEANQMAGSLFRILAASAVLSGVHEHHDYCY